MTTKTQSKVAPSKKESPKKQSAPKAEKKLPTHIEDEVLESAAAGSVVDPDELEEQEEAADAESSNQEGGNAAALAAASSTSEMSASFKNFRHHPDMENFYRFIYENDLRHEALAIIDEIMEEKHQRKLVKGAKSQAH